MANVFKNSITGSIGTSNTIAYQVPAATTTTIIGVSVANVVSQNISVSVTVRDDSANKTVYLVKDAIITSGGTAVLVGGEQKIVLEALDSISVVSSAATSADVIVSALELT
jgi:flagellar motor component MotA